MLNNILKNRFSLRVAVIVNDMSEINIDSHLVAQSTALSRTEEKLVEMTNGCICCTLRDDLLQEVSRLAREGRFDYLLIESTGISEPLPVAATFTFTDETGACLSEVAQLDTMVIDSAKFLDDFSSVDDLRDRSIALGSDDERSISDLLIDQIEFANVLVLGFYCAVENGCYLNRFELSPGRLPGRTAGRQKHSSGRAHRQHRCPAGSAALDRRV